MAGVVKWLRPRIVVPLCVGSNPTTRPIKRPITFVIGLFICVVDIGFQDGLDAFSLAMMPSCWEFKAGL